MKIIGCLLHNLALLRHYAKLSASSSVSQSFTRAQVAAPSASTID